MHIRPAQLSDLPQLKEMCEFVVSSMQKNGLNIWSEYYPYDEFESDITKQELFVTVIDKQIAGVFALVTHVKGEEVFAWQDKTGSALYISRLAVHPDFAKRGLASKIISHALETARKQHIPFVRLTVADTNFPAINLYAKNGFTRVDGIFDDYSPAMDIIIPEWGYEKATF